MEKIPYNCYIIPHGSKKGHVIPKAALIRNSVEVRNYLSEAHIGFTWYGEDAHNDTNPWLEVSFSASYSGNIYTKAYTMQDDMFNRHYVDNPYVKVFDYDLEAFSKYVNWAMRNARHIYKNKV